MGKAAAKLWKEVSGEKLKIMLTYGQLLNALTQPEATGTEWPLAFVLPDGLPAVGREGTGEDGDEADDGLERLVHDVADLVLEDLR